MRIAIIGAGGAGLAAAWLLEGAHDVTLFEADDRLGGHAHTVEVEVDGERVNVDAGFQFFGPGPAYATFNRLLDALQVPRRSYSATMTFTDTRDRRQVALPPWHPAGVFWRSLTPSALRDLLLFRRFLRGVPEFLARHDTTTTTAEYFASRRLPRRFVDRFLSPLLLAFWCVEPEEFLQFAAYNSVFYLGATLTRGLRPPEQFEIEGGMRTYVEALAASLERAVVRTGSAVRLIEPDGEGFAVTDAAGRRRSFDQVVLATDAHTARGLLSGIRGLEPLTEQLQRFSYFDTTIAVHGDRRLMPPSEAGWSVVNVRWDGVHSQLSIWNPARRLPVYRSWVTYEERMPEPLYATAAYRHLRPTVEHFAAQRALKELLGHGGVWLAGLYAHDADSHESAVRSAVAIAERLAPDGPRLRVLRG